MFYIQHSEENTEENPERASNYHAGIILHSERSGRPFGLLAEYRNLHGKLGGHDRGVASFLDEENWIKIEDTRSKDCILLFHLR